MEHKNRAPIDQVKLKFRKGLDNIDTVRGEISTSIICDKTLFLAYDESSAIERLRFKKGKYKKHKTFELDDFFDLPEGSEGEMDIEGLAWEEPYLWFTGSMSLKRNSPDDDDDPGEGAVKLAQINTDENRFSLGRVPCTLDEDKGVWTPVKSLERDGKTYRAGMLEGGTRSTILTELLSGDEHLAPFMKIPCKDNGFDIEGLAVFEDRIFLGLRGPVLGGWAIVLEFKVLEQGDWLIMESRKGREHPYCKHFIYLAGMGLREINMAAHDGDVYILAGPTMDLEGTISAWRIPGGFPREPVSLTREPERLFDVVYGSDIDFGKDKAEGMALTGEGDFLITFDSPLDRRLVGDRSVLADIYKNPNPRD